MWFLLLSITAMAIYNLELRQVEKDTEAINRQAVVLAQSLWNLDDHGSIEYLKISCKLNNYKSIKVFGSNNELFISVSGPKASPMQTLMESLGLTPVRQLSADILHAGDLIGRVEASHRHVIINQSLYIILSLTIFGLLLQYLLRNFTAKQTLEERVKERTAELALSEERYREIFNSPSEAIVIHDAATGSILDANRGLTDLLGYERDEIIELDIKDFSAGIHPYTGEMALEKIVKTCQEGPQLFEWKCKKKNGDLVWVEVALKLSTFGDKNFLVAVTRDISTRLQTEKIIRESEIKYRTLIETTGTGFVIVTESGTVLDANPEYVKLTGRKHLSDITGQSIAQWTAEHDRRSCEIAMDSCFTSGVIRNLEIDYVAPNGIFLPVEINGSVIEQDGTQVILAMVRDISQRKDAEQTIAEEQERLAVTLRSIGDGVITTDISGNVTMLNIVAEKLTGWSQKDASGKPLSEIFRIVNEKSGEECETPFAKVISTGQIIGLANHTSLIARDGSKKNIADSGSPIRNRDGVIIGVVLVFRDVTETQQMEQEALKARKLESVGVLAGGIAHDFNNILAAILGNVNLALEHTEPHNSNYPLLVDAEKACLRAKDLTQQLLTFSKGGEPVVQEAQIADLITDSASFTLRGSNVRCDTRFAPNLWKVAIDSGQISQVIQNLIINSSHAMPQGGVIEITCENVVNREELPQTLTTENYIVVRVKDSGVGIPESIIDHIFDPYFSTKQTGSGLGLAISHSIIMKHGGSIDVDSQPGVGTCFTIFLPASDEQVIVPVPLESTSDLNKHCKVMVMDDDKMVRDVSRAILEHVGFEVQLTVDGEGALALYQDELSHGTQADVLIMDLTIPGRMGGEVAVQEILKLNPEAKVIVSSGYSNDPIMAKFKDYGFCAAIVKPYKSQELYTIIQRAVNV
jgi:PAS domain S-box-containing protein